MTALGLPAFRLPDISGPLTRLGISPDDQRWLFRAALLALGVRIAILLIAYFTYYLVIGREGPGPDAAFHETLFRWDTANYERIAESGYPTSGEYQEIIVFFPLFPFTVKVISWVIGSFFVSALLLSAVASVAAGYFLQAMVRLDGGDEGEASRSLWYFFLFPTAYFLAVPYTEALFMALLLGSFYFARRQNWFLAGILGAFCTATRMQGILLLPALVVEAAHQANWDWRKLNLKAAWIALVPYGLGIYLLLNYQIHGDAFAFVDFQDAFWHHHQVYPWETLDGAIGWVTDTPPGFNRVGIHEFLLVGTLVASCLLILGTLAIRPSYLVFGRLSLWFFLSVTFQISMLRYIMTIFPMYIVLGKLGRNAEAHQAMITVSALLMGALFVVYATRWGF
ncbi:MAG TPA: mannosyltransferase family protein [Dehalococcoidia bacterium]|nr:mannosyltransferase family protein [Dehalococcoidia bacterium]